MGDGIVIFPTDGKVVAPVNGTVTMVFPTKHAIGMMSDQGTEILIHIGMDTVELEGKPYTMHVKQNQKVKKGDLLVEADLDMIKKAGKEICTPVVITNNKAVNILSTGETNSGEAV